MEVSPDITQRLWDKIAGVGLSGGAWGPLQGLACASFSWPTFRVCTGNCDRLETWRSGTVGGEGGRSQVKRGAGPGDPKPPPAPSAGASATAPSLGYKVQPPGSRWNSSSHPPCRDHLLAQLRPAPPQLPPRALSPGIRLHGAFCFTYCWIGFASFPLDFRLRL